MDAVPQSECKLHREQIDERVGNNTGHTKRVELTSLERIKELEKKWNWIIGLLILNLGGIISILLRGLQ